MYNSSLKVMEVMFMLRMARLPNWFTTNSAS